jgi:hypothetical protein
MNKNGEHEMNYRRRRVELDENTSNVNIGFIKINTIGKACSFTVSPSVQVNVNHTNKKTQGFGEHNSDGGMFVAPMQDVHDGDLVDSHAVFEQTYVVAWEDHCSNNMEKE